MRVIFKIVTIKIPQTESLSLLGQYIVLKSYWRRLILNFSGV